MSFRIPNRFVGNPAPTAAQVDANSAYIEAKFNGGITGTDLAPSAAVANTQLANSKIDEFINLTIVGTVSTGSVILAGLPGLTTTGAYTIKANAYAINNSANTSGGTTVTVDWGLFTAGVWVATTTIISAQVITHATDAPKSGALTMAATALAMDATNSRFLRLTVSGVPGGGTPSNLTISFRIQRDSGLTS